MIRSQHSNTMELLKVIRTVSFIFILYLNLIRLLFAWLHFVILLYFEIQTSLDTVISE